MADFNEAYRITMKFEGGYSNNPNDAGGETYKGISRKYNSSWAGWSAIDDVKSDSNFPQNLDSDENLQSSVKNFYKQNYWDVNQLDDCSSQGIGDTLFDIGVNMGVRRAGKYLQQSINLLSNNGSNFNPLIVDGHVGHNTLSTLDLVLDVQGNEEIVSTMINVMRGQHYIEYMTANPSQQQFARGWFSRVKIPCKDS